MAVRAPSGTFLAVRQQRADNAGVPEEGGYVLFFQLSTVAVTLILFVVVIAATAAGHFIGRSERGRSGGNSEPFGVMQAAMLGFMGLVLAFGLSLAEGRYEDRRAAIVNESNAIGTPTCEPRRCPSLPEPDHGSAAPVHRRDIRIAKRCRPARAGRGHRRQRACPTSTWSEAGGALAAEPTATAPRLYVESLNETFDAQSNRIYGLDNRVPTAVLLLEIVGAAIAWGCSRSTSPPRPRPLDRAGGRLLVTLTLVVTLDLDRPVRGLIQVNATHLKMFGRWPLRPPPAGP